MIICTIAMLVKHRHTWNILHEENRFAMTKAYLVDYVLKWLLALSISSQVPFHIYLMTSKLINAVKRIHSYSISPREFLRCLLYRNKQLSNIISIIQQCD